MFREKTGRHAATLSPQTTGVESRHWLKLKWGGEKKHLKMKRTFMARQQVESFILNGNKIGWNIPKLLQYYYSVTMSLSYRGLKWYEHRESCIALSQLWWDSFVSFSLFSVLSVLKMLCICLISFLQTQSAHNFITVVRKMRIPGCYLTFHQYYSNWLPLRRLFIINILLKMNISDSLFSSWSTVKWIQGF